MTDTADFFARDPDALSQVLQSIHMEGGKVLRCTTDARVQIPAGLRLLHVVEQGPVELGGSGHQVTLETGDMALLVHGTAHELGSTQTPRPLRAADLIRGIIPDGKQRPRWISGRFEVNDFNDVLAVLPSVVVVRADSAAAEWFDLSVSLLVAELADIRPGGSVMIARILDLLFIHALRSWSNQDDDHTPGWLTAALDPAIGRAASALHHDLAHAWTVAELADHARLSRTAFADRFARLTGSTPMAYLALRRLEQAATMLRVSTTPVAEIGATVGYTSEAAFSRAFARRYGSPPLRWRRASRP